MKEAVDIFYPKASAAWRKWLEKNHQKKEAVWLVFHKKASGLKSLTWSEAVDEALCFGWIDSKKIKIDETTSHQYFSRRNPKSAWSRINKDKVAALTKAGRMTAAGLEAVTIAKRNGCWSLLNKVDRLEIPKDLEEAFRLWKGSKTYFIGLSKSTRKAMLQWIILAKREATRKKRVEAIAELAARETRPKQF